MVGDTASTSTLSNNEHTRWVPTKCCNVLVHKLHGLHQWVVAKVGSRHEVDTCHHHTGQTRVRQGLLYLAGIVQYTYHSLVLDAIISSTSALVVTAPQFISSRKAEHIQSIVGGN